MGPVYNNVVQDGRSYGSDDARPSACHMLANVCMYFSVHRVTVQEIGRRSPAYVELYTGSQFTSRAKE